MPYQVIIPAGASRADDALVAATGIRHKALLPLGGKPMLAYVLDALAASQCAQGVTVIGLTAEMLAPYLPAGLPVRYLAQRGGLVDNLLAGIASLPEDCPVLLCTADIPLLSAQAVRDFVYRAEQTGADLCYAAVERQVMETRFPGSGRSFRPLVDGSFCGGDLSWVTPSLLLRNEAFGRALTEQRKNMIGLARVMGLGILIRLLTRRLRLIDLERRASRVLGGSARAIISPFAELAMDVDRPEHLAVVQRALDARDG